MAFSSGLSTKSLAGSEIQSLVIPADCCRGNGLDGGTNESWRTTCSKVWKDNRMIVLFSDVAGVILAEMRLVR